MQSLENTKQSWVRAAALLLPISLVAATQALAGPGGRDECWMTGGGSIFSTLYGGQPRITHGFELRCNLSRNSNLQVNDHAVGGWSFHLEELTAAICIDDPAITPNPPDASFDTFVGEGVGRCKNVGGQERACVIRFTFTDGGEVGGCIRDTAIIEVRDFDDLPLISVSDGYVNCGNHQAHSN
jgi:hypothetical protein